MRKFSLIIGVTTTASLICAALIGMEVARVLPAGHLTSDVRDAASLPISIIGTLAALVLGLMVSTAKDARAERGRQIAQISVNWVRLNRIFLSGIFPAHSARAQLQALVQLRYKQVFPEPGEPKPNSDEVSNLFEALWITVAELPTGSEVQKLARGDALVLMDRLAQARFSLDKVADENVPGAFLYTLIAWLALVYFSRGLFAPLTPATAAIYFLSAVAFGSAVLLVLEIDNPQSKIVRVSPSAMKHAIAEITRVH